MLCGDRSQAIEAGGNRFLLAVYFLDSGEVAPAFKFSCQPNFNQLERLGFGDRALADSQAVAVVVGAVPDGRLLIPAKAAAHAFNPVGDDGLAVARTAQDDTALGL